MKAWPALGPAAATLLAILMATPSLASDVTTVPTLDVGTTGQATTSSHLASGRYGLGLDLSQSKAPLIDPSLERANGKISSTQRASVLFGLGITSRLQLSVGLHVTSEKLGSQSPDELFPEQVKGQHGEATAFSGATVLSKYRLTPERSALAISAALFAESGAGESAAYAVSRSQSAKGGWLLLASYGAPESWLASMGFGWRYRNPEEFYGYKLRNEALWQAGIEGRVAPHLALTADLTGRRLMVARTAAEEASKYKPLAMNEYTAGIALPFDSTRIALYGGKSSSPKAFGVGETVFGLSVTYTPDTKQASSGGSTIVDNADDADDAADGAKVKRGNGPLGEEGPVSIFDEIDRITEEDRKAGREVDDFAEVEEEAKKEKARNPSGVSEAERMDIELEELRHEEELEQQRLVEQQKADEAKARAEHRRFMERYQDDIRDLEEDVQEQVNELPDISDDEVNWNGID